jgi:cytochrome d ubiquinol oxidase subunit II
VWDGNEVWLIASGGIIFFAFSTHDSGRSITIANAAAAPSTLRIGFVFWSVAIVLAVGYFVYLFRSFAGKVRAEETRQSH